MPIYLNNRKIGDLILTVESASSTTHDATISSSNQLMAGVTAYGPMGKITGTMPVVTVPDPTLTVRNDGLVTVTLGAISAGYLNATNAKQATRQLDTLGATTYTPGTTAQTIASGKYLTGIQTIAGDADLVAGNIKQGVEIFGVTGTFVGGTDTSDATATAEDILVNKTAYVNGVKITGTMVDGDLLSYGSTTVNLAGAGTADHMILTS